MKYFERRKKVKMIIRVCYGVGGNIMIPLTESIHPKWIFRLFLHHQHAPLSLVYSLMLSPGTTMEVMLEKRDVIVTMISDNA
jgi:hypothetical protein